MNPSEPRPDELADVPSPVDLCRPEAARQWADQAALMQRLRLPFFDAFVQALRPRAAGGRLQVLELGSGPGFLAEHLLRALPTLSLTLLDHSVPMQTMARERLWALNGTAAAHVQADFKRPDWSRGLGPFDAVITLQAVHELRHKRHAAGLHAQVRTLLAPGGCYLMGDHHVAVEPGESGMRDERLYMRCDEHEAALRGAGFANVEVLRRERGLVLYAAWG